MPKAISPETDYKILADIAINVPSKEIAENYGVSLSYVSKIRRGKKQVKFITSNKVSNDFIVPLENFIRDNVSVADTDVTDGLTKMIISKLEEVKTLIIAREIARKVDK